MSIYSELKSLALNQYNTDAALELDKKHADLLNNGDLKALYKVIEADSCENQRLNQANYACEVLVTDYQ